MKITKEDLEQRIKDLSMQANNLLAQYNQVLGGIAYCHQLIADLEEELPTIEEAVSQAMPGVEVLGVESIGRLDSEGRGLPGMLPVADNSDEA